MEEFQVKHESVPKIRSIELVIEGQSVGSAVLKDIEFPFPTTIFWGVLILSKYQGKGYGSKITDFVIELCSKEKRAGLVKDSISSESQVDVKGMYERAGFLAVPGSEGVFAINIPQQRNISELHGVYEANT